MDNQARAGWPATTRIFQRVGADVTPPGDTTFFFVVLRANTSKRALVRLRLSVQAVAGDSERESNDDLEAAYLRRVLIGDRTFARGSFWEALQAFQSAQALLPTRAAAAAKEFLVLEAAGGLPPATGDDEAARARRELALYPMVAELGDALAASLAPLEGMRASRIRTVRQGLLDALVLARNSLAHSLAQAGDVAAAALVFDVSHAELMHLPKEAMFQAQWATASFFRQHGDWGRAATQLERLSRGDAAAAIV